MTTTLFARNRQVTWGITRAKCKLMALVTRIYHLHLHFLRRDQHGLRAKHLVYLTESSIRKWRSSCSIRLRFLTSNIKSSSFIFSGKSTTWAFRRGGWSHGSRTLTNWSRESNDHVPSTAKNSKQKDYLVWKTDHSEQRSPSCYCNMNLEQQTVVILTWSTVVFKEDSPFGIAFLMSTL